MAQVNTIEITDCGHTAMMIRFQIVKSTNYLH